MIALSYVIAIFSLLYYFSRRLKKIDPDKFSFKFWFADNVNELIKSLLALAILMPIATNKQTVVLIEQYMEQWPDVFRIVPYPLLAGLVIGLLNYWILDVFRKRAKREIGKQG